MKKLPDFSVVFTTTRGKFILLGVLVGITGVTSLAGYILYSLPEPTTLPPKQSVLAVTTTGLQGSFIVNVPTNLAKNVNVGGSLNVLGETTITGDLTVNGNYTINANDGTVTASNLIYSITEGEGITVTGGQNPIITNSGVLSLQGQTGAITLTAGDNITIDGTTISANNSGGSTEDTFKNITAGGTTVSASGTDDTFTFAAGTGITLGLDAGSKTLTIIGTDSTCSNCVILDPTTTQTITPTGDITGLSVAQGTGGTADIFNVTDNSGATKYFSVDASGNLTARNLTVENEITLGGLAYTWPGGQNPGDILQTNGSGVLSWVNPGNLPSVNNFQRNNGTVAPINISDDILVGNTATASAYWRLAGTTGQNSWVNNGNFGIGDVTPTALLTVGDGDLFQVNSSGAIAAATGLTSSGTIVFSDLGSGIVKSSSGTLSVGNVNLTTEVTGTLAVGNGGTGGTSFTSNGVILGNGSSALAVTAAGTTGQVLRVGPGGTPSFGAIDLYSPAAISGVLDEQYGGTGITTYAVGDLLYASASGSLARLAAGSADQVLAISGGVPVWASVGGGSGGLCATCVVTNPTSTQTISPTGDITGLAVRQTDAGSPTADIFAVANNAGDTKYFYIDASGNVVATNLNVSGTTTFNGVAYSWTGSDGSNGEVLTTDGSGNLSWTNASGIAGVNDWNTTNGTISPKNTTLDFLVGASATSSAKFGVLGIASDTPVASLSASDGSALSLGYDGTIQTYQKQALTIGGNNSGRLTLRSNGTTLLKDYGIDSIYLGQDAGLVASTTNQQTTAVGAEAGRHVTANSNSFFGYRAGMNTTTGTASVIVGAGAGENSNATGTVSVGYRAGRSATGAFNTFIGRAAGEANTSGNSNVFLGYNSGNDTLGGSLNTFLGSGAGGANTSGGSNIFVGYQAGDNATTGSTNIAIGRSVDLPSATGSNQLTIGNLIFGTGVDGTGTTVSTGNIGIGTNAPIGRFQVDGAPAGKALTVLNYTGTDQNILSASASGTTVFTINAAGQLYLADGDAPGTTTNMLYADSGNLFWDGVQINGSGTPGVNEWTDNTTYISPNNVSGAEFRIWDGGGLGLGSSVDPGEGNLVLGDGTDGGQLYLTGRASSASTTEGTIYYDTDDDQLKVYANGKWQADRTTVQKIVAASNSQGAEKADFVADGSGGTDDATTIEAAITALPSTGGVVVLLEGTYYIDSSVDITKSNVTVMGNGKSTVLLRNVNETFTNNSGLVTIGDGTNPYTNITLSDLSINGNRGTYTNANNHGILLKEDITDSTIKNLSVMHNAGEGIQLQAAVNQRIEHVSILNNIIEQNSRSGIEFAIYNSFITIAENQISENGIEGVTISSTGTNATSSAILNNVITRNGSDGIALTNTQSNTVSGNVLEDNDDSGIVISSASYNTVTGNTSTKNNFGIMTSGSASDNTISGNTVSINNLVGIYLVGSSLRNAATGNVVYGNGSYGIQIASDSNTVSGNTISSNTGYGIYNLSGSNNLIEANYITLNTQSGIYLGGDNSTISDNKIHDNGGSGANHGIYLFGANSDNNVVSDNMITDTAGSGHAINIALSASENNVLSGNRFSGTGATTISDSGTNTIYNNQQTNSTGDIAFRSGTNFGIGTTTPLSVLHVTGGTTGGRATMIVDQTGASTNDIFTASASGTTRFSITNAGGLKLGTDEGESGDCLLSGGAGAAATWSTCPGGTGTTQWDIADGAIYSGNSTLDFLLGGSATSSAQFAVLGLNDDTPVASISAIANGTGLALNGDGSIQSLLNSTLTIGGDTTGNIVFNPLNGQGKVTINGALAAKTGRSATVIVAASNSLATASAQADFVATGTDDDITIEHAIAALPDAGGRIVLLEGTFNIGNTAGDGIDLTKDNVTIEGQGYSTVLKRRGDTSSNDGVIMVGDGGFNATTNIRIANLSVDGTKATYAGVENDGIVFNSVEDSVIENVWVFNNDGQGIYITHTVTDSIVVQNSFVYSNDDDGIWISNGAYSTIKNNQVHSNGDRGILNDAPLGQVTISGNTVYDNTSYGIRSTSGWATISGNFIHSNSDSGIYVTGNNSLVDSNFIQSNSNDGIENGSGASPNSTISNNVVDGHVNGIDFTSFDNGIISGNVFDNPSDDGIDINSSDNNMISGNNINAAGANGINNTSSSGNTITGNNIEGVGASGHGILIFAISHDNSVVGNTIYETSSTGNAIFIDSQSGVLDPERTYIADNKIVGTWNAYVNDEGDGTIYANQNTTSSGDLSIKPTRYLGIGLADPHALLHVSGGIMGGNAAAIINQTGASTNDIFTASASGTTRFSITNAGGLKLGADEGTDGQCLLSGGAGAAAVWSTCPGGTGNTQWDIADGAIFSGNSTLDLLLGGSASSSAKFAVLGLNDDTPVASISAIGNGTGLALNGDGSIQSLLNSTLTIGGDTTGNMVFSPLNGAGTVTVNGTLAAKTGGSATFTVAANDSSARAKAQADYVATGTNDDATIETAIAALPSGGGIIALFEGTYIIDSNGIDITKSNVTLTGTGRATVLQRGWDTASNDGVVTLGDDTNAYSGITISNLSINGAKGTYTGSQNIGIMITSRITLSTITSVNSYDNDGYGLYANADSPSAASANNAIRNSEFTNNDNDGVSLSSNTPSFIVEGNHISGNDGVGISSFGSELTLSNNRIIDNEDTGAEVFNGSGTITGNFIDGNAGHGIEISNSNTITGNTISNNDDDGIHMDGNNSTISSNNINFNGQNGVQLTTSSGGSNTITGNNIYANGDNSNYDAIRVANGSSNDNNVISSNTITDFEGTGYGISIAGSNVDGTYIIGNDIGTAGFTAPINDLGTNTVFQQKNALTALGTNTRGHLGNISGQSVGKSLFNLNYTGTGQNIFTASSSGTTRFVIDSAGQVGIGTATPQDELDVHGTGRFTSTTDALDYFTITSGDTATTLQRVTNGSSLGALTLTNSGTVSVGGFLGVGVDAPQFSLDIEDNASSTASAMIYNTDSGASSDALALKIGATTAGTGNHFVSFLNGNGEIIGKIQGNGAGGVTYATEGVDFAEYYKKADNSEQFSAGDLVCHAATGGVTKCADGNDNILGIVSDRAGFVGGASKATDPNYVLVGITGQLPVKITGTVQAGDALSISAESGVATKAEGEGYIVGYALESNNGSKSKVLSSIQARYFKPNLALNLGEKIDDPEQIAPTYALSDEDNLRLTTLEESLSEAKDDMSEIFSSLSEQTEKIQELEEKLEEAGNPLKLTAFATESASFVTIDDNLLVLGTATMGDLAVTDRLAVGNSFIIQNNAINTLGGNDLEIQPLRQGGVSFLAGLVTISTDGTVKIKHNLDVSGNIRAQSLSGIDGPLAISGSAELEILGIQTEEAQTASNGATTVNSSAGKLTLKSGQTELRVNNDKVNEDSLIFITSVTSTRGSSIYVESQSDGSFVVALDEAIGSDITFNFLVIN